jgi:RNA polymerase sigma-70 factor (ECF subfamily)
VTVTNDDDAEVTTPADERPDGVSEPLASVGPAVPRALSGRRVDVRRLAEEAYDAYQRELFGFALASTRDATAAEEVVQEAFLRLVMEAGAGRVPDLIRPWLFRVAANLITSRGRRRQVADRMAPRLVSHDVEESPEAAYYRRELGAELASALDAISPDERNGVLMAASGFSGREIAAALGRTEGATRTMLFRARLRIQRRLEGRD